MGRPSVSALVRLSLLERVSPNLLVSFLRPFQGYLGARGLSLEGESHDHAWVGRLHELLVSVDPQMPAQLQQALLDVADLASDQGHELALELAGERQLSLFPLGSEVCAEDMAFKLYLEHSALFAASHARVKSLEAQRFVDFFPVTHRPLLGCDSEPKRVLMISQLRRWFADRNRSEYVDVRTTETTEAITFLVIHGRPPRSLSVITSPFSRGRLSFVPDKQDTLVFDKATGRLSVNAQFPAERDFYRKVVGRLFFDTDNHFQTCEILTCEPLLEDADEALSVAGLPQLEGVRLRELGLEACDYPYDNLRWKARDLRPLLPRELPALLRRARTVRHVKLAIYFKERRRAKLVTINPPNKLTFDRRTDEDVVRDFLFTRGFLRHPDAVAPQRRALA